VALWAVAAACGGGGDAAPTDLSAQEEQGRQIALDRGCQSCHSIDGDRGAGPTWKGLAGSEVTLVDGSTVTADAAYLRESILDSKAKVVESFSPIMPEFDLSDDDVDAVVAYIEALAGS
jgi:cytochrome c oxidase subunit 2